MSKSYPFAMLRRDKNEKPIRDYLRANGYLVWPVSGTGVPDLLVWSKQGDRFHLIEVKNPSRKKKGAGATAAQVRFEAILVCESAPVHTAWTPEEALEAIRKYDKGEGK